MVDEWGAAVVVDLVHRKLGGMAGERVEEYWERIMRGTRTPLSQPVPKFVSLYSGRPQNRKRSLGAEWFAGLLKAPIESVKRAI